MIIRAYIVCIALVIGGCATSAAGPVKELEPGTYQIGVSSSNSYVNGETEALSAAVEAAGEYCRAKGQRILIVPTQGREVTFHCRDLAKSDD